MTIESAVDRLLPPREQPELPPLKALHVEVREDRSEMVIRLDPPELGQLHVQLTSESGLVTARLHARSEAVRSLLEENLPLLRSALSEAGLSVQNLSITAGAHPNRFEAVTPPSAFGGAGPFGSADGFGASDQHTSGRQSSGRFPTQGDFTRNTPDGAVLAASDPSSTRLCGRVDYFA